MLVHSSSRRRFLRVLAAAGALCFVASSGFAQQPEESSSSAPFTRGSRPRPKPTLPITVPFTGLVIFGDSLSDDGNIAHCTDDKFDLRYPGDYFNYASGRFTDGQNTDPGTNSFFGVWHEQLAALLPNISRAVNSLDGGTDYAFGGATTRDGVTDRTVIDNPTPFGGGRLTLTIDNLGRQLDTYLGNNAPSAKTLYIVWGGGNDLFDNRSTTNVLATAQRVENLILRLASAGARQFLVPNVPPLGEIPEYNSGDAQKQADLNAAAAAYRDQLNANLDDAEAKLTAAGTPVKIYRLDVFDVFNRLVADPAKYGFGDVIDSAQGADTTADRSLFWDSIHPTTAGHFQIAAEAYTLLTNVPVVEIAALKTSISERTGESGTIYFTRTGSNLSAPLTVNFTVSGTARVSTDYLRLPTSIVIPAGTRTAQLTVQTRAATRPRAGTGDKSLVVTVTPSTTNSFVLGPVTAARLTLRGGGN